MKLSRRRPVRSDKTGPQAAQADQRAACRFPPLAGSDAALGMASKQRAKSILQSLDDGDIRQACNDNGVKDIDFLNVFRAITKEWKLTNAQRGALLGVSARTYQRWKSLTPQLTDEQLLRISYLWNLFLDLQAIHNGGDESDAVHKDRWVKNTSIAFGDLRLIDVMTHGTLIDMYNVYNYVHFVATL